MTLPKILTITVTEEHIRVGRPVLAKHCPIALAIKDQYPVKYVGVDPISVYVVSDDCQANYAMTPESKRFVRDFDNGFPVEPATFSLPIESE